MQDGQGSGDPPPPGGFGQDPPPGPGFGQDPPPGPGYEPPPEPPPRSPRLGGVMIFVVVAALAAALGAGAVLALQHSAPASVSSRDFPKPGRNAAGNGGTSASSIDVAYVAGRVRPGMVDITSRLRYTDQVFEGTGMIISPGGLVLTNNHVINGATSLTATLVTSGRKYTAEVVGTDAAADVALLKLAGAAGLPTVHLGNSGKVAVRTPVVALGNAGGAGGSPAVTSGIITALNRTIMASDAGSGTTETLRGMLQTNAPIQEGDSGGPLANAAGQVIGMDTAANTRSQGGGSAEGFAIPINRALGIVRQMAAGHAGGQIHLGQPAFLGIEIASGRFNAASTAVSPRQQLQQLRQAARADGAAVGTGHGCLPGQVGSPVPGRIAPVSEGTLVAGVFCGAPAHAAGMEGGDVITAVDGQRVTSPSTLTTLMLARYRPGNTVSVSWVDTSGKRHTSTIRLAAGPAK